MQRGNDEQYFTPVQKKPIPCLFHASIIRRVSRWSADRHKKIDKPTFYQASVSYKEAPLDGAVVTLFRMAKRFLAPPRGLRKLLFQTALNRNLSQNHINKITTLLWATFFYFFYFYRPFIHLFVYSFFLRAVKIVKTILKAPRKKKWPCSNLLKRCKS